MFVLETVTEADNPFRLPPFGLTALAALRDRNAEDLAEVRRVRDLLDTASRQIASIPAERQRIAGDGYLNTVSTAELRDLDARETEARSAADALQARIDQLSAEATTNAACLRAVEAWLADNADATFAEAAPVRPEMPADGETLTAAVARLRAEIEQAKKARTAVQSGAPTVSAMKAAIHADLDAIAASGAPDLSPALAGNPIPWPATSSFAFAVWLNRDAIAGRLDAEIEALAAASAQTPAQRQAEADRIAAVILDLERREEATITAAHAQHIRIERRADAAPVAVLGLAPIA